MPTWLQAVIGSRDPCKRFSGPADGCPLHRAVKHPLVTSGKALQSVMREHIEERLKRLRGWKSDLKTLIAEAVRAGDTQIAESANAMLVQCKTFILEAEEKNSGSV